MLNLKKKFLICLVTGLHIVYALQNKPIKYICVYIMFVCVSVCINSYVK